MTRFRRILVVSLAYLVSVLSVGSSRAQEPTKDETKPESKEQAKAKAKAKAKPARRSRPDGPRIYQGRVIAPVMGYQHASWLVRDTRDAEEQPDKMLDSLKLTPGMTVADVGAGVGYTSLKIAKRVGPTGKVLATDIQPQMLRMLRDNAKTAGVKNVHPILCTDVDPKLPEGAVDLILMVDVYHECSEPEIVLEGLRKALKPNGRLVLVEFRAEDPEVPIRPEHKMSVAQVRKEIEPKGFALKELHEFLPWQHIIIFEKTKSEKDREDDAKKAESAGERAEKT